MFGPCSETPWRSRNLDRQEDEALVDGRQVSSDRSHLPHMASAKKLSAALCPVLANYDEVGPHRVLGILTALNHPAVSWVSTSRVLGISLRAAGRTSPPEGSFERKGPDNDSCFNAFAPWCGYSALPARSAS
jgi:hypothetical protein